MKTTRAFAFLSHVFCCTSLAWSLPIETVPVGNPGNTSNPNSFKNTGAVAYDFRIGKTEITNAQYVEFLNSIASSDPYNLYNVDMGSRLQGGIRRFGQKNSFTYAVKQNAIGKGPGGTDIAYSNKPVGYVSWFDTIRFANWMHNGQGNGDTESGAYTLLGGSAIPSNVDTIIRNLDARWYLPSRDEWHKAAYHKNDGITGNYWEYPTSSDIPPDNNPPSLDSGNSANIEKVSNSSADYFTNDVGGYSLSSSPYGTLDQAGNSYEWLETRSGFVGDFPGSETVGGNYTSPVARTSASNWGFTSPTTEGFSIGFRVASIAIPEPTTLTLATLALCLITARRRR